MAAAKKGARNAPPPGLECTRATSWAAREGPFRTFRVSSQACLHIVRPVAVAAFDGDAAGGPLLLCLYESLRQICDQTKHLQALV